MSDPKIPFLPGNSFPNLAQHDFRKPHSLGYVNGYATQPQPILGIGLQQLSIATSATAEELLARIGSDPNLVYGNKRFFAKEPANQFVPAHVAFDKVVQ